jgi:hypothetical protein
MLFFVQIKKYGGGIQSTEENYIKFCIIDTNSCRTNLVFVRTSHVAQIDIIDFL